MAIQSRVVIVPINFDGMDIENIFFCVLQKKVSHSITEVSFWGELSLLNFIQV